jgi:hypothetical protein
MNRYDVLRSGVVTHSYLADSPLPHQPEWGTLAWTEILCDLDGKPTGETIEHPATYEVVATDITYECDLAECHRLRATEYPSLGDQMDALYKRDHLGDSTQWDALCQQIAAVKAKYPKPTQG